MIASSGKKAAPALSAPTLLASAGETSVGAGSSFTTASFTPANNSFIIMMLGTTRSGLPNLSSTASGGGLTWTLANAGTIFGSSYKAGMQVWMAPAAPASSMAVTIGGIATNSYFGYAVLGFTGAHASPIGAATNENVSATGAASVTLSGSPLSSSFIVCARSYVSDTAGHGATPGSGYTSAFDSVGTGFNSFSCEYATGITATSVPWGNYCSPDTIHNAASACAAIEIRSA